MEKYKKNKYRFALENFLFSSNFTNETNVTLLCCDGLSNAKEALINSELKKVWELLIFPKFQIGVWLKDKPKDRRQFLLTQNFKLSHHILHLLLQQEICQIY